MRATDLTRITSGIAALAGPWAMVAPFLWPTAHVFEALNVLLGVVVAVTGAHTAYRASLQKPMRSGAGAVSLVAGALLIGLPVTFGYGLALLVTDLTTGILTVAAPVVTAFAGGGVVGDVVEVPAGESSA